MARALASRTGHMNSVRTANLHTKIKDFRGFDSIRILILRGGIPRPMGDFPQAILVGLIVIGRFGVDTRRAWEPELGGGNACSHILHICVYIYIYISYITVI